MSNFAERVEGWSLNGTKCATQAYGRELSEAYEWCQRYRQSRRDAELHQAWDLYYHVFKRINKQLPSLTVLELQYVAPALVRAQVCILDCFLQTRLTNAKASADRRTAQLVHAPAWLWHLCSSVSVRSCELRAVWSMP